MPEIKNRIKGTENITVSKNLKDYSDDPFFKEKKKRAKEFLEKSGLLKKFSKKK